MTDPAVGVEVSGGNIQGIVGAGSVIIENATFYGRVPEPPVPATRVEAISPCPYPGLAYFEPADAKRFFGRDAAIKRLEEAVGRQSFTALVGASGSGKSSVVLAGLAPRLHAKGGWRFTHFRVGTEPDKNPFTALARALVPLLGSATVTEQLEEVQRLAETLDNGSLSLTNVLGACRASNPNERILLIADQFEEVFTLVNDEQRRGRFVSTLLSGFPDRTDEGPPDICVILTMRADFYGMALNNGLSDALQGKVENLGPMTQDELRDAIVKPADPVTFEDGLVDTLLDEVETRPGSLPLLQFALREMWGRLETPRMTRTIYDAIGGVEGALAQRAQTVFDDVTAKGADARSVKVFRQLLLRMVSFRESAEDTRRVVEHAELGSDAWALAQRLAGQNNRLVVMSALSVNNETVELTHEALIRNWPTFAEWIHRDRDFQTWLSLFRARADEWRKAPQDSGTLLSGGLLKSAEQWFDQRADDFNDQERAYLKASAALRDLTERREQETFARDRAQLAQLRAAQLQKRRLMVTGGALVAVLAISGIAWWQGPWLRQSTYWLFHVLPYQRNGTNEARAPLGPQFKECTNCPEMVVVPKGQFTMGGPLDGTGEKNEYPRHEVTIGKDFAVSRYEVTIEEWNTCVSYGNCNARNKLPDGSRLKHPANNVSWQDAQLYAQWLEHMTGKRYRLLTEAEWEYAARAKTETIFPFGDEDTELDKFAWYEANTTEPREVGTKQPNQFGMHDMLGNVAEWVQDCFQDGYRTVPTNGAAALSGDCNKRVVRGGDWQGYSYALRPASRTYNAVGSGRPYIGFRVARDLADK